MFAIDPCPLPENALLAEYARVGAYTDCFRTEIPGCVTQAQFIDAFYTSSVFKLERIILKWLLSKPSSDAEAKQLAAATIDSFAAWQVEKRCENQLLLADFQGRTRSWLMVSPAGTGVDSKTRLYFGSAIVSVPGASTGETSPGTGYRVLLEFHRLYSVILLYAARSRLERNIRAVGT